ncbi:exosortase A [Roseateles sp. DAIF2]|uniref:exosortase A n=1 Tax=Roseateles sp. DAIF2 TaxID=2714952 RepID=UPI0018A2FC6F|nr:exosortase A [Roseateles sp. DAIF2]QPF73693.1 exosortase A [Roseateles sp. DAIF2]
MSMVLPAAPSGPGPTPAWRRALPLMVLALLALLWLYRETGLAMVGIWQRSETFAHAFVVPPIALWLIWRRRTALAALTPRPNLWFLLPLALASLAWLLGELVAVNALTQLALVAQIVLLVPLLWGWQATRVLIFPLAFLFFSVPIGEFMLPGLMEMTADFTVAALRLSGIPVYREGLQFVIPSGNWSVVEACSGLRYLMASVMVGTLFAYLSYYSLRRRLIFIGVAILLPLLGNWLRAYLIVMLGHLSDNKLAAGADHLIYGWVFFGILMLAMFMVGARWTEAEPAAAAPQASARMATVSGTMWLAPLLALVVFMLPPLALSRLENQGARSALQMPAPTLSGWARQDQPLTTWQPVFENPVAEVQQVYARDGERVGLHLAYYRQQAYDSKLISSQNQLVHSENKQWAQLAASTQTLLLGPDAITLQGADLRAGRVDGGTSGTRLLAWQIYWVDGRPVASPTLAKALGAWQRLRGQGDDAASIVVYTDDVSDNGGPAERRLREFLQDNWASIDALLKQTAGR